MPRQDVPYPGAGRCSLRCEIANLWNALKTKLHSINGVQGDGNGDVKILAGQNVQIVNDQVHGEITISATDGSAEDIVKSVNGELPDADGAVTVDTGVMTVNGVSADADGEVTITAGSNITITSDADTNSIEISAEGGSPEAVAPIYIDQDGKIALKDWVLVTSTDWSIFNNNHIATEDMVIALISTNLYDDVYVPKGCDTRMFGINAVRSSSNNISTVRDLKVDTVLNNSATISFYLEMYNITTVASSGINENIGLNHQSTFTTFNKIVDPTSTAFGFRLYRRA